MSSNAVFVWRKLRWVARFLGPTAVKRYSLYVRRWWKRTEKEERVRNRGGNLVEEVVETIEDDVDAPAPGTTEPIAEVWQLLAGLAAPDDELSTFRSQTVYSVKSARSALSVRQGPTLVEEGEERKDGEEYKDEGKAEDKDEDKDEEGKDEGDTVNGADTEVERMIKSTRNTGGTLDLKSVYGYYSGRRGPVYPTTVPDHILYSIGNVAVVHSAASGTQKFFVEHQSTITALVIDLSLTMVASADNCDNHPTVVVWNAETRQVSRRFKGPPGGVRGMCFNRSGTQLAAFGLKDVRVWEIATGRVVFSGKHGNMQDEVILQAVVDPFNDTFSLVTIGLSHCRFWKIRDNTPVSGIAARYISANGNPQVVMNHIFTAVAFTHKTACVVGTQDGMLMSFIESSVNHTVPDAHEGPVLAMAGANGAVVSTGPEGCLYVWDYNLNHLRSVTLGYRVASLYWIESLVVATEGGSVLEVHPKTGKASPYITGHDGGGAITGLVVHPGGSKLITVDDGGRLCVWDHTHYTLVLTHELGTNATCLAMKVNGSQIAVGTSEHGTWLLSLQMQVITKLLTAEPSTGEPAYISCVAYCASGTRIAAGTLTGYIAVYDTETMELASVCGPQKGSIVAIDWATMPGIVRAECTNSEVKYWNTVSGGALTGKRLLHALNCSYQEETTPSLWETHTCAAAYPTLAATTRNFPFLWIEKSGLIVTTDERSVLKTYVHPFDMLEVPDPAEEHNSHLPDIQHIAMCTKTNRLFVIGAGGHMMCQWDRHNLADRGRYLKKFKAFVNKIIATQRLTNSLGSSRLKKLAKMKSNLDADAPPQEDDSPVPGRPALTKTTGGVWTQAARKIALGAAMHAVYDPVRRKKLTQVFQMLSNGGKWTSINMKETAKYAQVVMDDMASEEDITETVRALKPVLAQDWVRGMDQIAAKVPTWKLVKTTNAYLISRGVKLDVEPADTFPALLDTLQSIVEARGGMTTWETGSMLEAVTGSENKLQEASDNRMLTHKQWRHVMDEHLTPLLKDLGESPTTTNMHAILEKYRSDLESENYGVGKLKVRLDRMEAAFKTIDQHKKGSITFNQVMAFNEMMVGSHVGGLNVRATSKNMLRSVGLSTEMKVNLRNWLDMWEPVLSGMTDEEYAAAMPTHHQVLKVA
mmetsp:Transcript_19099/g.44763  ORF Transcript_19099/g.44763 Transcript_19099/m.44763 type:complete len:1150 (+) Transcript_19099:72-3521(+)